jgi:hypothetical protein
MPKVRADEWMNVLVHNDVSGDDEPIALSHLLQHFEKQVTAARSDEQRQSAIATASKRKLPNLLHSGY